MQIHTFLKRVWC